MKCKLGKFLLKLLGLGLVLNVGLFCVFFFDLDGKFLFYVYEPFMKKHYDEMPRNDMTKMPYQINKPNYEYEV